MNDIFFEKLEKYFKGKVAIFTDASLILYQYPVDLLNFETLHFILRASYEKFQVGGNTDLLAPFVKAIVSGCEVLKVKIPVYVREMRIHLPSTAIVYIIAHVSTSL